jgi:hypothetical protein
MGQTLWWSVPLLKLARNAVPRTAPPSRIDEPVHVILGSSAAGSLRQLGGRESIILHDHLCPGPCDVNPARHLRKRRDYLLGYVEPFDRDRRAHCNAVAENLLGGRQFAERIAAYPSDRPVVFWTSPAWTDRLAFWWALDALKNGPVRPGRCWVAEPRLPAEYHPPQSLGAFPPREFKAAFAVLRPLTTKTAQAGAGLWQKYAAASPVAFDRARRTPSASFPDLPETAEAYGTFFPHAVLRPARLKLSAIDQALFDALAEDKWLRPVDLLKRNPRVVDLVFPFGDLFLLRRLREWAAHRRNTSLHQRDVPQGVNEWTALAYLLTPHGSHLRDWGLERPTEAPPLYVGGCRLYAEKPTWARRERGGSWWIGDVSS